MRPEHLDANRRRWDELVGRHLDAELYDVAGWLDGRRPRTVPDWVWDELGEVAGADVVHLQCHFGLDTLSLARQGANVTGLDFSPAAVEAARGLAERAGLSAEFVCADVHDAVRALGGRTYDVVFTGLGALVWLPAVRPWAEVVAGLLRPGGFLYLAEFHPVSWTFAWAEPRVCFHYLERPDEPYRDTEGGDYADREAQTSVKESYEWNHGVGEVVTALIDAGLRLSWLHERVDTLIDITGFLVERGPDAWVMPEGELPLSYSLRAEKPA